MSVFAVCKGLRRLKRLSKGQRDFENSFDGKIKMFLAGV